MRRGALSALVLAGLAPFITGCPARPAKSEPAKNEPPKSEAVRTEPPFQVQVMPALELSSAEAASEALSRPFKVPFELAEGKLPRHVRTLRRCGDLEGAGADDIEVPHVSLIYEFQLRARSNAAS